MKPSRESNRSSDPSVGDYNGSAEQPPSATTGLAASQAPKLNPLASTIPGMPGMPFFVVGENQWWRDMQRGQYMADINGVEPRQDRPGITLLPGSRVEDSVPLESGVAQHRTSPSSFSSPVLNVPALPHRQLGSPPIEESLEKDDHNAPSGTEHTGRWTADEHEIFLKALNLHGKDWKKVAAMVKTRTVVQTRTHAQKYFQKLQKMQAAGVIDSDEFAPEISMTPATAETRTTSKEKKRQKRPKSAGKDKHLYESQPLAPQSFPTPRSPPRKRFSLEIDSSRMAANPMPSPVACGKRKAEELTAAQMLVQQAVSPSDAEIGEMLSAMKQPKTDKEFTSHRPFLPPFNLTIQNPDSMASLAKDGQPATPWDLDVKKFEEEPFSDDFIPEIDAFHKFIARGNLGAVQRFLVAQRGSEGLDKLVNSQDSQGFPSIVVAASRHTPDSLSSRLTTLGGTGKFPSRSTPSTVEIVELLLGHGANPTSIDPEGNTSLHWACERENLPLVTVLCTRCPINDRNSHGDTALHIAARRGAIEIIEKLIENGASTVERNTLHMSPLDVAGLHLPEPDCQDIRQTIYKADPRCRTLVISHDDCLAHLPPTSDDWERPERIRDIMFRIRTSGVFDTEQSELEISSDFDKAPVELLARAHSREYIKFVNELAKRMDRIAQSSGTADPVPFTPQVQQHLKVHNPSMRGETVKNANNCDTYFSVGSLKAARRAAGAVMFAVDSVLRRRNRNAFCVVRPPGHHAGVNGLLADAGSHGFCIFNNVAAGALHALEAQEHSCKRVAVIDLDVHHGNGTEEIVRSYASPERLLFFSIHLFDHEAHLSSPDYDFYPGSGAIDDTPHNIINVPLPPLWRSSENGSGTRTGTRSAASKRHEDDRLGAGSPHPPSGRLSFRHAISSRLLPALRAFNPELILVSIGFDAMKNDVGNQRNEKSKSLNGIDLQTSDYFWVTQEIQKVADMCCGGRVVSVLEGGYGCSKALSASVPGAFGHAVNGPLSPNSRHKEEYLDRDHLAAAACAHLKALVNPYGTEESTKAQSHLFD